MLNKNSGTGNTCSGYGNPEAGYYFSAEQYPDPV